jgi:hypothetical protein
MLKNNSEQNINDYKTSIGLLNKDGKSELIITIWGDYLKWASTFPANFWGDIKDENDIKAILEIVSSYTPIK